MCSQFKNALHLNVCLLVVLWEEKIWLTNTVENLCAENMVSKYDWENARVTREHNYPEINRKHNVLR